VRSTFDRRVVSDRVLEVIRPVMLQPLSSDELLSFRNDLRERFKRSTLP
jgi:hypothetical protein